MYPDVTAIGHYCPVIDGGGLDAVDGTSCSSPLFATIVTLLNQHQIANGKSKLGFINPVLYMMYYENVSAFEKAAAHAEAWLPLRRASHLHLHLHLLLLLLEYMYFCI